jgi:hypothetical protein
VATGMVAYRLLRKPTHGRTVWVREDLKVIVVEDHLVLALVHAVAGLCDVGPHVWLGDLRANISEDGTPFTRHVRGTTHGTLAASPKYI